MRSVGAKQAQPRPQRRVRSLRTGDQSYGIRVQATQRDLGVGRGGRGAEPRAQRLQAHRAAPLHRAPLSQAPDAFMSPTCAAAGRDPHTACLSWLHGIRQDREVCRDSLVPAPAPFVLSCPSKVCPRAAPAPTQGGPGARKKAGLEPRRRIDFSRREIETLCGEPSVSVVP